MDHDSWIENEQKVWLAFGFLRRSKIFRTSEAEQHSAEKNGLVQFN